MRTRRAPVPARYTLTLKSGVAIKIAYQLHVAMKKHTFEHSRKNSPSCQFRERMIKISKIRQFFQRKMNNLQCDKILTVKNYWSNEQPVDFFSRASTLFSSLSLWSPRLFLLKLGIAMFSTILVQISRESKKIFFTWNPSFRKYVQGELENGWA